MKMKKGDKAVRIQEMNEKLASAKGIYLADFTGLTVEKASLLRREMRKAGVHVQVMKNTLLNRAIAETGYADLLPSHLNGPTAILLPTMEEIAPARILEAFVKEHKLPAVKLAVIEGKLYGEEDVKQLAKLPPRDVLLGMLLRALQGPLSQFVSVLNAPLREHGERPGSGCERKGGLKPRCPFPTGDQCEGGVEKCPRRSTRSRFWTGSGTQRWSRFQAW